LFPEPVANTTPQPRKINPIEDCSSFLGTFHSVSILHELAFIQCRKGAFIADLAERLLREIVGGRVVILDVVVERLLPESPAGMVSALADLQEKDLRHLTQPFRISTEDGFSCPGSVSH
jgi:hypothetical protein